MSWGYHLIMDCAAGSKVDDKENIHAFIKELVPAIDMVAYGEPWIERFATHDATKAGISFCQMIETSNITGHFVDGSGDFYIDVFSCKPFEPQTVADLVNKYFSPKHVKAGMIERDARTGVPEEVLA
jgi:S-adenosylmethionine/arginine decarboxylase-like enzyme